MDGSDITGITTTWKLEVSRSRGLIDPDRSHSFYSGIRQSASERCQCEMPRLARPHEWNLSLSRRTEGDRPHKPKKQKKATLTRAGRNQNQKI
jgi:hypothetical protein